jgi:hypothetical protein
MNGWIGTTGNEWFAFLSRHPESDEVNFRQAGRWGAFEITGTR